jgi:F0F1-type ATP synthase delta subunit
MHATTFARALLESVEKGEKPAKAVAALHTYLEKRGQSALMPRIFRSLERLAARDARKNRNALIIARVKDEKQARKQSRADDAEIVIDASLIGGWRLEKGNELRDASWKSYLLSMYRTIAE